MSGKKIRHLLKVSIFFVMLLTTLQCTTESATVANLPDNIFGIKPGMSKEEAEIQLRKIGDFKTDAEKRQQIWMIKNDPRFSSLAVGYEKDNQVRYVTAFAEKENVKQRVRFTEIGDVAKAKQEITKPHYRYTWIVEAINDKPAYVVTVYGTDPEFLSIYSLAKIGESEEEEN